VPGLGGETTAPIPATSDTNDAPAHTRAVVRLTGTVSPEVWNRVGIKLLPKLRNGQQLQLGIDFRCETEQREVESLVVELKQALTDLRLSDSVIISVDE